MAGRVCSSAWVAILAIGIMLGAGAIFFGVEIFWRTAPAAIVTFIVGVAAFSALGLMVSAVVPSSYATLAVTNATLLPLAFVSNVFIPPRENMPAWIEVLGDIFPLKHFAAAFGGAFNPTLSGSGFQWSAGPGEYAILSHLAVMAVWGLGAALVALRTFTWEPRGGERPRRRRRRRRAGGLIKAVEASKAARSAVWTPRKMGPKSLSHLCGSRIGSFSHGPES